VRDVPEDPVEPIADDEPLAEHKLYRPTDDAGYSVDRGADGLLRVAGPAVERLLARHDMENEEALRYVEERLRKMGVIRALEQAGFKPGDDVELAGTVFELDPGAPF
jgi:GTP-binding protein